MWSHRCVWRAVVFPPQLPRKHASTTHTQTGKMSLPSKNAVILAYTRENKVTSATFFLESICYKALIFFTGFFFHSVFLYLLASDRQ